MRLPARRHVRLRCLAPAAAALLGGCAGGVWDPRGPVAAADRHITFDALAIMLAIVIPTLAAALAFAWWFRASNPRARRMPGWVYSGRIELLVWSVPLLTIMFLGGVIWIGSHRLDPYQPITSAAKPLEVQAVSLDWKWLFIYPEQGVAAVNQLVVPAGVPLHFSLTSASVMNMFFVPQLGSMMATMNGMVTQLNLQADQPGDYFGESTQFSGDGFSDMNFTLHAVPADEFELWAAHAREGGPTLDRSAYELLARQSSHVQPFTYGGVDASLFQGVVSQQIPPGPGPQLGRGGPGVNPRGEGQE